MIVICFLVTDIALIIFAAILDYMYSEVPDIIWDVILCMSVVGIIAKGNMNLKILISLIIYFIAQEIVMRGKYGIADSHAFCSCAMIMAMLGCELEMYVIHMTISFALLSVSQFIGRNVGRNLKLKVMVPMIPYIATGQILALALFIVL